MISEVGMTENGNGAPKKSAAIFVDGSNVAHELINRGTAGHPLSFDVDLLERELRWRLGSEFRWKFYYLNHRTREDLVKLGPFVRFLRTRGWEVVRSQCKQYANNTWRDKRTDIVMALDAFRISLQGCIQDLVLFTHDSDFAPLFERVPMSVKKWILGWKRGIATELKNVATPIFVDDLWHYIYRRGPRVEKPGIPESRRIFA